MKRMSRFFHAEEDARIWLYLQNFAIAASMSAAHEAAMASSPGWSG